MTGWLKGFTALEMRILSVSLVLMMACVLLLANERLAATLDKVFLQNAPIAVGEVLESQGVWQPGESVIHLDDTIVVGENGLVHVRFFSGLEATIFGGGILHISPRAGDWVPDMVTGRFQWQVSGMFKVLSQGQAGILRGDKATLEVFVGDEKKEPTIKVTHGSGGFELEESASLLGGAIPPKVIPSPNSRYFYVWHFKDLYEFKGQDVEPRPVAPIEVPVTVTLNWDHPQRGAEFSVQLANARTFTGDKKFFATSDLAFTLERAYLGPNFWRVGYQGRLWSQIATFHVEARYSDARPRVKEPPADVTTVTWSYSDTASGYLTAVSSSEQFLPETTRLTWVTDPKFAVSTEEAGVQYLRVRAVNAQQEVSEWSVPVKIIVR